MRSLNQISFGDMDVEVPQSVTLLVEWQKIIQLFWVIHHFLSTSARCDLVLSSQLCLVSSSSYVKVQWVSLGSLVTKDKQSKGVACGHFRFLTLYKRVISIPIPVSEMFPTQPKMLDWESVWYQTPKREPAIPPQLHLYVCNVEDFFCTSSQYP